MKVTQGRTLDAGRRVQGFLDTNAAAFAPVVTAALRAKLDEVVNQFTLLQAQQDSATSGAAGETKNQAALRLDLFDHFVVPIGEVAKKNLKTSSDLPALVITAAASHKVDFVAKVNSLIDAAVKSEQLFIEHGLAPDFVAQMRASTAQVTASATNRNTLLTQKKAASGGLVAIDVALRSHIKVLNGVLGPVLKKNPTLASGWAASKLIHQKPVNPLPTGGIVTASPSVPAPAPAPAPSAATPVEVIPKPTA